MLRLLKWLGGIAAALFIALILIVFVPAIRTELLIALGLAALIGLIAFGMWFESGDRLREAPTRPRRARDVTRGDGPDSP
ncbi:hypothetical protein [Streptomyces qinzhouensis]|uniref:DUF4175 domain-containing protein n=1 Tax=Streptomyces qinzhouensis TaxID=2599401 RepID=A0A5B8IEM8_9ACTN|nr:hypothetical protein [Streptomyces qinzhouensis]QDY76998.1 hypothetical protein FQU76_11250 [Streptomyces qinzhouensis]